MNSSFSFSFLFFFCRPPQEPNVPECFANVLPFVFYDSFSGFFGKAPISTKLTMLRKNSTVTFIPFEQQEENATFKGLASVQAYSRQVN